MRLGLSIGRAGASIARDGVPIACGGAPIARSAQGMLRISCVETGIMLWFR